MKLIVFILHIVSCSGFPFLQRNLAFPVKQALTLSLSHVNNHSTGTNLYRLTSSSVRWVTPMGLNSHGIILRFGVRETVCLKSSLANPDTCDFKRGLLAPAALCSSRLRLSGNIPELLSLSCGAPDSSSSESSSSEEMYAEVPVLTNPTHPHVKGGFEQSDLLSRHSPQRE